MEGEKFQFQHILWSLMIIKLQILKYPVPLDLWEPMSHEILAMEMNKAMLC